MQRWPLSMAREPALHRNIRFSLVAKLRWGTRLFVAGVCDPGTGLIETGYSLKRACRKAQGVVYFRA